MKPSTPPPSSNPSPKSRVVKPRTPVLLIVSLILGCSILLAGIFYVLSHFQTDFMAARMPGIIIDKTFVPAPRQEVILDNRGNMQVRQREGDFSLTVRVQQSDGNHRDFTVSNVPQAMFESVEVGQRFDVGPYLLPRSATEDTSTPAPASDLSDESAGASSGEATPEPPPVAVPAENTPQEP